MNDPVYRTLLLVRHGQFSLDTLSLTRRGREQAARTGERLRDMFLTKIHCSTMQRAEETALIIAKHHPRHIPKRTHLLRECLPSLPRHVPMPSGVSWDMIRRGKSKADRAYRRYFKKSGRRPACEVLVCHGNVIRYLVGRALGLRNHGWYQLGTSHCGITIIRISREGRITLDRYNDTGHLPRRLRGTG